MTRIQKAFFLLVGSVMVVIAAGPPTTFSPCDVNRDGSTTVGDVQAILNEALGGAAATDDLTGDRSVDVADVQIVINAALNLGCPVGPPTISGFNPSSGPIGTLVTVTGSNFGSAPQISMPKLGGGTIGQPLSSLSAGSLSFAIVAGTASGPITLTTSLSAVSTGPTFTVTPANTFDISLSPSSATLIQGQSVSYSVQLSSSNGFNQLAALTLTGAPGGISATFAPPSITAGQTSVLTLTAPANQPVATASLSITASATIGGLPVSQSSPASMAVVAPTTSFLGRTVVANASETPLAGVTVSMLGKDGNGNTTGCAGSTVSDGAGNFALVNLPSGCVGPQLVGFNGVTATSPLGTYAGVNIMYTLVAGQVTASPVLVHLPRIDNVETFNVAQNSGVTESYSFSSIPGLSVTVYPGTTFTLEDGTQPNPFPLAAVQVPVDRLPDLKPNVPTMIRAFIVAFQPANATTNQPVAVTFPNTLNTVPGTDMVLMTLDPTHGQMVPYGTGAVSANALQIVPDADPAHPGHLYGLVHFDWHGPMPPPAPIVNPAPPGSGGGTGSGQPGGSGNGNGDNTGGGGSGGGGAGCNSCSCTASADNGGKGQSLAVLTHYDPRERTTEPGAEAGDPVDLSSGLQVISNTDIAFAGSRGSVALVRTYRSLTSNPGPFGIGTGHNYGLQLNVANYVRNGQGVIYLVWPDGNQFPFSKTAAGQFVNSSIPVFAGAVLTNPSSGVYNLRYRNGLTYGFQTSSLGALEAFLTSISDPNGNTINITLNPSQPLQVTQVTDPVGRSLTFSYDGANRITSVTDPIGRMVKYSYNAQGTLASFTDANGGVTSYGYDANNNMIQMTDPRGIVQMQNTLDAGGRVVQQVRPDGGVLNFVYTLTNPLATVSPMMSTEVTDSLGVQETYRFNISGFVTDITNTQGQTEHFTRQNGTNLLLSDAFGSATTSYTYDTNGNVLTQTDPTGLTTSFTYDPAFGRITSIADPLGNVTGFSYDTTGTLLTTTDADGNVTSHQYNSVGQPKRIIDSLQKSTSLAYDGFGNLISLIDPLGNSTSYSYDAISRLTQTIDPLGRRTLLTYDGLGHVLTSTNAVGGINSYTFDPDGNLVSIKDANGSANTFTFDSMNRLVSRTDGLGNSDSRVWDADGNLLKYTDRRGQTSAYSYDNLNRLTGEAYSDATVRRAYDIYNRLTQVDDSQGGIFTFAYDLAGRLLGTTTPYGAVNYTYDGRGAMASRQVVGQGAVAYTYDPAWNLTSASMPQASTTFTYNARNQLAAINRGNGVTSTYSYDADARLLGVVHAKSATVVASNNYRYDAVGNRVSQATTIGQPLVTSATVNAFNAANQMTQFGNTHNSFDLNGNLARQGTDSTYLWDGRNRLQSIATPGGQITSLTYDFSGNLLSQTDSGPVLNLTRSFILDDLTDVAYETATGGTSYSVLTGRSIDSHLAITQPGGLTNFALSDAINSTIASVDQTGTSQARFFYEPFGQTSSTGEFPFLYIGRTAVSTGTYYFRARLYSPTMSRFLSEDPIGLNGGVDYYSYTREDPIDIADHTGLMDYTKCDQENPPCDPDKGPCSSLYQNPPFVQQCERTFDQDRLKCFVKWPSGRTDIKYTTCIAEAREREAACVIHNNPNGQGQQ